MAAAIRALEWDVGLKPRALLLEDGTLEFNCLGRRASTLGGRVLVAWEVATDGYDYSSDRPWDGCKQEVVRVVFDGSFADAGVASGKNWFNGFLHLREVRGFEALSGLTCGDMMFASCAVLESVYASSFDTAALPERHQHVLRMQPPGGRHGVRAQQRRRGRHLLLRRRRAADRSRRR